MLKLALVAAMPHCIALSCYADELHVPSQFATIQAAVDAANTGDEIVVAAGTYRELLDLLGKQITLRSTDPANAGTVDSTIISGDIDNDGSPDGTVVFCGSGETLLTSLSGLTIRDGLAPSGGGVFVDNAALTIDRCDFTSNTCSDTQTGGGAIAVLSGSLSVVGCDFNGNATMRRGIDIYSTDSDIDIDDCDFSASLPDVGRFAVFHNLAGSIDLVDCRFTDRTGSLLVSGGQASVALSGCSFERGVDGSIDVSATSVQVNQSVFRENALRTTADVNHASSLAIRGEDILVEQCVFDSNSSDDSEFGAGLNILGGLPVIRDCQFVNNSSPEGYGAAISSGAASTTIDSCYFYGNKSNHGTVDIVNFNTEVQISECAFVNNSTNDGGAFYLHRGTGGTVRDCFFAFNHAFNKNPSFSGRGGAIFITRRTSKFSPLRIVDSTFLSNTAEQGGAIYADSTAPFTTIERCEFYGNSATEYGGAVMAGYNFGGSISHCIFAENHADMGGALTQAATLSYNNTFFNNSANTGASIWNYDGRVSNQSEARNNIIAGVSGTPHIEVDKDALEFEIDYSIVTGGYSGDGAGAHIYDADPLFVRTPSDGGDGWGDDPTTPGMDEGLNDDFGDLRLSAGSPAIDAGDNAAVPLDIFDLDGDGDTEEPVPFDLDGAPRFVDDMGTPDTGLGDAPIVDLGVYEFLGTSCLADVNGDGAVTPTDFSAWINAFNNNLPECDQNGDGTCTPTDFSAWINNFNNGC
jgi:predicted outer membrane repeat protein